MTGVGQRRTLGRYELLELIGRGSATEAFRAKSFGVEGFEKRLVVKRVLPNLAASDEFLGRFLEHVQRAMRLSHANLAQVFDLGRDEDAATYFLATEYVSGLDAGTLIERAAAIDTLLPLPIAAYLALEVGKALDHAHRRKDEQLQPLGIVHGAVAPHNVLVSFDGDVKVTDFGVMRALVDLEPRRESLGRAYAVMAPEQARGEKPTVASDVFSLGAFFYAALAGAAPFAAPTAEGALTRAARHQMVPLLTIRPGVPPPVAAAVTRALAPDPADRFPSVSSFYEELLASVHACGLRCGATDVAAFVDQYREAPETLPTEGVDALLSRPITIPPEARSIDPGPSTVPPLTGFDETRHVSALVATFRQRGLLTDVLRERMRAVVARYGGTVVGETDGELAALFGLEDSDGRDMEVAVRCGLVLVRTLDVADVGPSVGINAGRLRQGDEDVRGSGSRTERLLSSARTLAAEAPRVVGIPRRLAPALHGRFSFELMGSAIRVTEFAQDGYDDAFVGRREELQSLGETLVTAARGSLRLLRIVGEPGVGKTRLAVEMKRRLARGSIDLQTFIASCPPRGGELLHSGVVAMLRRICGVRDGEPPSRIDALEPRLRALGLDADETHVVLRELGAGSSSPRLATSSVLRNAVLRMMHSLAEDKFTVFIWDDAHELDPVSAEIIVRATTRLAHSRLALVVCARDIPGATVLDQSVHAQLRLEAMSSSDVERLVAARLGVDRPPPALLEFLRERASGLPMFVEELLSQLGDRGALRVENGEVAVLSLDDGVDVPRTLRALTFGRLQRLTDDERHLFVAAAVLEPPVAVALLARMVNLPQDHVDAVVEALMSRGLLRREGSLAFGFPSPLVREVVLAELDADDLANLHRRAASAHVAILGPRLDEEADRPGYHLAAAGDRDAAADFYSRGGLHALAVRKLERATLDLAYALELTDLEHRAAAQIGNWLSALTTAVRYVRTGPNLPALIERLVERALGPGVDPLLRAHMRIDLARILGSLDQELAAESLLDRGASDITGDPGVITEYLVTHAELTSSRGELRLARRSLDPLARSKIASPSQLHRIALSMSRTLGGSGKIDAARTALDDAAKLVPPNDPLLAFDRAAARIALHENAGEWREAAESSMLAASQAEELGLVYEVASSLVDQAVALARLGDLGRASAASASALSAAEEVSAERVLLRCHLVRGYVDALDGKGSLESGRAQVAVAESRGWIRDALLCRYLLGRVAVEKGARDEAREELLLGSRIAASTGNHAYADQFALELDKLG